MSIIWRNNCCPIVKVYNHSNVILYSCIRSACTMAECETNSNPKEYTKKVDVCMFIPYPQNLHWPKTKCFSYSLILRYCFQTTRLAHWSDALIHHALKKSNLVWDSRHVQVVYLMNLLPIHAIIVALNVKVRGTLQINTCSNVYHFVFQ